MNQQTYDPNQPYPQQPYPQQTYQQTYPQQPYPQQPYPQQTYQQTYSPPQPYSQQPYVQTYQQPYPPQPNYGQNYTNPIQNFDDRVQPLEYVPEVDTAGRFKEDKSYRDIFFLIFFVIHFVGIATIIGVGLNTPAPNNDEYNGILPYWFTEGNNWIVTIEIVAILVIISIILSVIYIQLMKLFPLALIYLGIGVTFLSFLCLAIYYGIRGNYGSAIIIGIFALLVLFFFYSIRSRIPFAVEMIKNVSGIIQLYPGTQVTAYCTVIIQVFWIALWLYGLTLSQRFRQDLSIVALVFLIFSYYWVMEVLKNVVHVTVSGVVATVYFRGNSLASPTLGSLKRAMTTSFGSICFGSLIVSFIRTLRALVNMMRMENNGCLLCVADCILGCLDSLIQYFNHYAYCQVAIYGKSFIEAAKATWQLFKHAGFEAIANDNLLGGVLTLGIVLNALITGGIGVALGLVFKYPDSLGIFIIGFILGLTIMLIAMQVIDSAIACSFVCFAEDREVLRTTNPGLYQRLVETYHLGW